MKRISFFLILCALVLSFGLSAMAAGIVEIRSASNTVATNPLQVKPGDMRIVLAYHNDIGLKADISNGFTVSSTDGAIWDSAKIDSCGPFTAGKDQFKAIFSGAYSWKNFFLTSGPGLPDVMGFLGAGNDPSDPGQQLPAGFNDTCVAIRIFGLKIADTTKHICLDSSGFPPSNTWKWVGTDLVDNFPAFVNTVAGGPAHGTQGFCWEIYKPANQPPTFPGYVDPTPTGSHSGVFSYTFPAVDGEGDPITYTASMGTIDATGHWTFAPIGCTDTTYIITITASDLTGSGGGTSVTIHVHVTNAAPVLTCPSLVTYNASTGNTINVSFAGSDVDGDSLRWTTTAGTIVPTGKFTGKLSFSSAVAGSFPITVGASDGCAASNTCLITVVVTAGAGNAVVIEKLEDVAQGTFVDVNVTLKAFSIDTFALGGFDFLFGYDNSALSFQSASTGALYANCKWEYFTYRFGATGNCTGGCPSGLIRVMGLAETNNGAIHPTCQHVGQMSVPVVMFSMKFLVSNNRLFECQYVPIRFFWDDCGDNTLSSYDGSRLILEKRVYNYVGDITDPAYPFVLDNTLDLYPGTAQFPGFFGIRDFSCHDTTFTAHEDSLGKKPPFRDIDFYNGGIDIICAKNIDDRGDINLNKVANEIADVVMFTNYFIKGLGAFEGHVNGSIAASDVNADGLTLTVADLVYLIRIVVGDALPYDNPQKVAPVAANYTVNNGVISVDKTMGGAFIVVSGDVKPQLLVKGMDLNYAFDGLNTRIVVAPVTTTHVIGFSGNFISIGNAELVSIELATAEGATVAAKQIPANFALKQNYPNPFNPTTKIGFSLPTASQYTLTIYNVTGQSVAEFTGTHEAGEVTVDWTASNNASGVYFYKLTAGNFTATKKMVLLK